MNNYVRINRFCFGFVRLSSCHGELRPLWIVAIPIILAVYMPLIANEVL